MNGRNTYDIMQTQAKFFHSKIYLLPFFAARFSLPHNFFFHLILSVVRGAWSTKRMRENSATRRLSTCLMTHAILYLLSFYFFFFFFHEIHFVSKCFVAFSSIFVCVPRVIMALIISSTVARKKEKWANVPHRSRKVQQRLDCTIWCNAFSFTHFVNCLR